MNPWILLSIGAVVVGALIGASVLEDEHEWRKQQSCDYHREAQRRANHRRAQDTAALEALLRTMGMRPQVR